MLRVIKDRPRRRSGDLGEFRHQYHQAFPGLASPPWRPDLPCESKAKEAAACSLHLDNARRSLAVEHAAYREAEGITDPEVAISLSGHQRSPELETMRQEAIRAPENPDNEALIRAASNGELQAQVIRGRQAQAAAPEPAHQLRAVALAEAEAKIRAADPGTDQPARAEAASLTDILSGQRAELEAVQAAYERWSATTAEDRERVGQAEAELERRQAHTIDGPEPIGTPEPELPETEPEPEATPEADSYEPEAAGA